MDIKKYQFTGYTPSGNPFLWLYDENKSTAFATSLDTAIWDKEPKIGDNIEIHRNPNHTMYRIEKVLINEEVVYVYSEEKERQQQAQSDALYDGIKREKGFIK